jgi:hypothetical protein
MLILIFPWRLQGTLRVGVLCYITISKSIIEMAGVFDGALQHPPDPTARGGEVEAGTA